MTRRALFILPAFALAGNAGTAWTKLWIEPTRIVLRSGEKLEYRVMGLHGMYSRQADLTRSPYLVMFSSDLSIVTIDKGDAMFEARAPGHAELRFYFGRLKCVAQVDVIDREVP